MPSPALILPLLVCATAHPTVGFGGLPADLPPWGAALLAQIGTMQGEISTMKATISTQSDIVTRQSRTIADHSARIEELEAGSPRQPRGGQGMKTEDDRRLLQQQVPASSGRVVHVHSTSVLTHQTPGNHDGRHRRMQGPPSCGSVRAQAVQDECCNEPSEDCSGGAPHTCNSGCSSVFLPFWTDCSVALHLQNTPLYQSTVALCRANTGVSGGISNVGGGNVVREFQLVCADGSTNCVPSCGTSLHGDLLLLAVNGEDSKYSCELHNGLYSWVGPAADGGFIGSDVTTFVSAVVSGAAGLFVLTMQVSSSISTLLTIEPGQTVSIGGNSSHSVVWGTGGFSIMQHGSLTLSELMINGPITVAQGATLQLSNVQLQNFACLTVGQGSNVVLASGQTRPPACAVCNPIPHCHTQQCTGAGVSVCARCNAGYYAFRRVSQAVNAAGSCVDNSNTAASAGLTRTSTGSFTFTFSGTLPNDLISGNLTLTASAGNAAETTVVSLTGTGIETLGVSLTVNAAQLSLAQLQLAIPSTTISNGGSLSVRNVSGSMTHFTVSDATFNHDASNFYLSQAVSFANAGTISLSDANFGPATSLSVSHGTACNITASDLPTSPQPAPSPPLPCQGKGCDDEDPDGPGGDQHGHSAPSLNGLTVTDATFSLAAASTLSLGGTLRFDNAGTVSLIGTDVSASNLLAIGGGTVCYVTSLALPRLDLFDAGSTLTITAVTLPHHPELGAQSGTVTVNTDGTFAGQPPSLVAALLPGDPQCARPYTTLNDAWRGIGSCAGSPGLCMGHSDATTCTIVGMLPHCVATGVGGDRWYRFEGVGGDALPLTPSSCGTSFGLWLTGWSCQPCRTNSDCTNGGCNTDDNTCRPPSHFNAHGRYPAAAEGVVEMTACGASNTYTCIDSVNIGVVRCAGFLLWRLPFAMPASQGAYCTTTSGIF
eukprot:COSAG01_NODE_2893_length_6905_cov_4.717455_6_plen_939_part_00